jgi:hypothetical protein
MSIINFFGENLTWSLLLQGCFFTVCLLVGMLYLIDRLNSLVGVLKVRQKEKKAANTLDGVLAKTLEALKNIFHETINFFSATKLLKASTEGDKTIIKIVPAFISMLLSVFLLFILVFGSGVMVNRVADNFLDRSPVWHLGLKGSWVQRPGGVDSLTISKYKTLLQKTDEAIKLKTFDDIFSEKRNLTKNIKREIYYNIKHNLLANPTWQKYLESTQQLINHSQVLVLSFFVLFTIFLVAFIPNTIALIQLNGGNNIRTKIFLGLVIALIAGWIICLILFEYKFWLWWLTLAVPLAVLLLQGISKVKGSRLTVNFLLLMMSFLCYKLSGISWRDNEFEFDSKVFGVYKSVSPNIYKNEILQISDTTVISQERRIDSLARLIRFDSLKLQQITIEKIITQSVDSVAKKSNRPANQSYPKSGLLQHRKR